MAINKHFNQVSNKIISLDEFARRERAPDETEADVQFAKDFLQPLTEWEDGSGLRYFSEMKLKEFMSNMAAGLKDEKIREAITGDQFEKIQKALDDSEDHTPRLAAGRLVHKPSANAF